MNSTSFRLDLARRVLSIVAGAGAVAASAAACGGKVTFVEGSGSGGAGGGFSSSSHVAGSGTGKSVVASSGVGPSTVAATSVVATTGGGCGTGFECFVAPPGGCPAEKDALQYFSVCTNSGCAVESVDSGPMVSGDQCCYAVHATFCGVGRPFVVDGEISVARVVPRDAWRRGPRPSVTGLSAEERDELARAWRRDALLEHASIASFARFALDLLALGAPADLVADAHRAALDEIAHAELCFALASAYDGAPTDPGLLRVVGGEEARANDLIALAVSTFEEGCIGETAAALVAAEQLGRASDSAVRAALTRIAEDESRHAELAWRTLAWAVRAGGREVVGALVGALDRATSRSAPAVEATPRARLQAHGGLDESRRQAIVCEVLRDIVAPALSALASA
ncbi:MAG: ferritin-like domain-containing protein [Polyangiaceae bacterium]